MAVKSPLSTRGPVTVLPAEAQRKAGITAAVRVLTDLPDADREFQRQVLRELLYALGLAVRPEPEPIEVAAS